ncbi:MAG TPA: amidohydrolase family protein, partial [Spirochaetia bacterium]|nr:amidohydrolase family protein [Spirochaetia bacterium]
MAGTAKCSRVIALEEAFLHPKLMELFPVALQQKYAVIKERLMDVGPERISRMDAAGIDLQVLSHVEPGVQFLEDPESAIRLSVEINDWLADIVGAYPSRFAGFAALPTQSPEDAARELERTVTRHGFVGALINGHTRGKYLDDESFAPIWERAQKLDVPIYIHPTDPPPSVSGFYYGDSPPLITGWGWQVETGTHLLKLITGGVFDRYPKLKVIVGHMGELLPFCFTRVNTALTMGEWLLSAQDAKEKIPGQRARMEKSFSYYMSRNVYVTTSGVFDLPPFECALNYLGIDNILFSVDDPFQDN